jgi:hypothetical protein
LHEQIVMIAKKILVYLEIDILIYQEVVNVLNLICVDELKTMFVHLGSESY